MNRFKGLNMLGRVPQEIWIEVHKIVQEAVTKTIPKKMKCKKTKWLSEEALQIAENRREAKDKGERERCTQLNADFQRIARRDKKAFLSEQCKGAEKNNKLGKTKDLFKKIEDTKGDTKWDQSWVFIGRTDVEAETPILWPPDVESWLTWTDPDAGKDWGQEEKGTTEDEMAGWHHWLNGHEFEETPGVGDGQGGLACCSPWSCKESDTTQWLNWSEGKISCKGEHNKGHKWQGPNRSRRS